MSNRHCDPPAGGEPSGWTKKRQAEFDKK